MTEAPAEFFKRYSRELFSILNGIDAAEFASFIEVLKKSYEDDAQVFVCGNGGSASNASHLACDINKGVSYGRKKRFRMISLSDNIPTIMAYANDVSYDDIFMEQLKNYMNPNDLLIGISGSGNSENILKAIRYGNENGAMTFGICGYGGGKLKDIAQKFLVVNSEDMQKVEDAHLIIFHTVMQWFMMDL
ncbi:MAG: SIS domain-containing protein [Nitrospirae bacterium]|nr:SIS domain-containing protein [Nitrospirota bacterium]